jgi:hypothetical protein
MSVSIGVSARLHSITHIPSRNMSGTDAIVRGLLAAVAARASVEAKLPNRCCHDNWA